MVQRRCMLGSTRRFQVSYMTCVSIVVSVSSINLYILYQIIYPLFIYLSSIYLSILYLFIYF